MKKLVLLIIIPLFILSQEFETNLPIVLINTNGNEILDETRIISDMEIIYNTHSINTLLDQPNNYNGKISIELRGSSSQELFPKKPSLLNFCWLRNLLPA